MRLQPKGGVFYVTSQGAVIAVSSEFSENESIQGAVAYLDTGSSSIALDNCVVSNNIAGDSGGIFYGSPNVEVLNSDLKYNEAVQGAVLCGSGAFRNCRIVCNSAGLSGSVVYGLNSVVIDSCVIEFVMTSVAPSGAVAYMEAGMIEVTSTNISACGDGVGSTSGFLFVSDWEAADISIVLDRVLISSETIPVMSTISPVVVRNTAGLSSANIGNAVVLDCSESIVWAFCPAEYCSDTVVSSSSEDQGASLIGISCYCYPDGEEADPLLASSCLNSAAISEPLAGVSILKQDIEMRIHKPSVGVVVVQFSNMGDVRLAWIIAVLSNPHQLAWNASAYNGSLAAGAEYSLALKLGSDGLQAGVADYDTAFVLHSTSPEPTPNPQSKSIPFVVHTVISADPSAFQSRVHNVTNGQRLAAGDVLPFAIVPVDDAGTVIVDASHIAYTARMIVDATGAVVVCSVAYDFESDAHRGTCNPPALVAGTFAVEVFDATGLLVGGQAHTVEIAKCPASYLLDPDDSMCKCPAGSYDKGSECAVCLDGSIAPDVGSLACDACPDRKTSDPFHVQCDCLADYYKDQDGECSLCPKQVSCAWNSTTVDWVLEPGIWRSNPRSTDLRTCRFGMESCPGTKTSNCTAPSHGRWPHCGCGYAGPMCAVCDSEYFVRWSGDACDRCGAKGSRIPAIVFGSAVVASILVIGATSYLAVTKLAPKCVSKLQTLYAIGEIKLDILFYLCQVCRTGSRMLRQRYFAG